MTVYVQPGTRYIVCGGDYGNLHVRDDCQNTLHDWPIAAGYVDSFEHAGVRLRHDWSSRRCPDCRKFGWIPGSIDLPKPYGTQRKVEA